MSPPGPREVLAARGRPTATGMLGGTAEDLEGVEDVDWRGAETVEEKKARNLAIEQERLRRQQDEARAAREAAAAAEAAEAARLAAQAAAEVVPLTAGLASLSKRERRLKRLNTTGNDYREGRARAMPFWVSSQARVGRGDSRDLDIAAARQDLHKYMYLLPILPRNEDGNFLHVWSGPAARLRFIWRRTGLRSDINPFMRKPSGVLSEAQMNEYYTMVSRIESWEQIWDKLTYDVVGNGARMPWDEKYYMTFMDATNETRTVFANAIRWFDYGSVQYESALRVADSVDYQMNLMHVEEWEMAWSERVNDVDPETAIEIKPRHPVAKLSRCAFLLSDIISSPYARFLIRKQDMPSDSDTDYRRIVSANGGERMCLDEIQEKLDRGGYSAANPYPQLRRDLTTCFQNAIRYHKKSRLGFDPVARFGPGMTHTKARAMARMCATVYVDGWEDDATLGRVGQLSRLSILEKLTDSTNPPASLSRFYQPTPDVDARRADLLLMLDLLETLSDINRGRMAEYLIQSYPSSVVSGDDGLHRAAEVNVEDLSWRILKHAFTRLAIPLTLDESQQGSGVNHSASEGSSSGGYHQTPREWSTLPNNTEAESDERFKKHVMQFLNRETQRREGMAVALREIEDADRRDARTSRQQEIEMLRRSGKMPMDPRS